VIALKRILVATDFSEPAEAALRYGTELTRRFDASLHVLHVVDDLAVRPDPVAAAPMDSGALQMTLENEARANLAELVPEPDRSALRAHLDIVVSDRPAQAILAYARDAQIDLIIAGTHGRRGLAYFFMGSVAHELTRTATCPVLTVRAHAREFIYPDALQILQQTAQPH
jgi:nucleotide-binding universal stress UspA family protein